jgi:hypothetical protein
MLNQLDGQQLYDRFRSQAAQSMNERQQRSHMLNAAQSQAATTRLGLALSLHGGTVFMDNHGHLRIAQPEPKPSSTAPKAQQLQQTQPTPQVKLTEQQSPRVIKTFGCMPRFARRLKEAVTK